MSPTKPNAESSKTEVLQGTLDLLILRVLELGSMHGWAISRRIQQVSREVILVQQGSLYPSLHRLARKGWVTTDWGVSENNRRAKFYRLTREGRRQLQVETETWLRLSTAVGRILKEA